jgi:hypothetical protein
VPSVLNILFHERWKESFVILLLLRIFFFPLNLFIWEFWNCFYSLGNFVSWYRYCVPLLGILYSRTLLLVNFSLGNFVIKILLTDSLKEVRMLHTFFLSLRYHFFVSSRCCSSSGQPIRKIWKRTLKRWANSLKLTARQGVQIGW